MTAITRSPLARSRHAERLFVSATFITFLGNNIQLIATSLLVFKYAGTALSVGWVFILAAVPQVIFSAIFGRIADRFDRRRLCIMTDLASAAAAAALPVAIVLGGRPSTAAYAVSFALSLLAAMFMPASSALFKERVTGGRLGHFSANYEIAYQGGALLSGALGGFVAQLAGLSPLFYFNAATFLGSAACLLAVGKRAAPGPAAGATAPGVARDAPAAAPDSRPPVARLGALYAVGIVIVTVANTLLLVAVVERFRQGAGLLGVADALAGIGMIAAAAIYRRVKDRADYRYLVMAGYVGCAALALVQPIAIWTLLPGILLGGLTFGLGRVPTRAELMRSIEESKAGRVFGTVQAGGLAASVLVTVAIAAVVDHHGVIPGFVTLALLSGIPALAISMSLVLSKDCAPGRPQPSGALGPAA